MKTYVLLLCFAMCVVLGVTEDQSLFAQEIDSISGASEKTYYDQSALTGEALWQVIKERNAAFAMATTNADGSPNLAVCIPGFVDEQTLVFGLAPNQTQVNLKERGYGIVLVYQHHPEKEDKFERNVGARLIVKFKEEAEGRIFVQIVKVLPLG